MNLSKIEICNNALLAIGQDIISSLDTSDSVNEGSQQSARLCNALFDQALYEVLRLHKWNCCTKRASLVRLTDTPTFGYEYKFQLPNDYVRLLSVYSDSDAKNRQEKWVLEGDTLLFDYNEAYIQYVAIPQNVAILDSLCTQALIANLGAKLATALHLDDTWSSKLKNELISVILPQARSIDTMENKELLREESQWILSRFNRKPRI